MAITLAVHDSTTNRYSPGASSSSTVPAMPSYAHVQALPANSWVIQHYLGTTFVELFVFDALNRQVFAEPKWGDASANVLTVDFSQPLSGRAYLRPLA